MTRYLTVSETLECIADALGKDPVKDRASVIKKLNRIRREFYSAYKRLDFAVDLSLCLPIQRFGEPCMGPCEEFYLGVSLPPEAQTPESIFLDGESMRFNTRWHRYSQGFNKEKRICPSFIDRGRYATTCDWAGAQRLKFLATEPKDKGKEFTIKAPDHEGEGRVETYKLLDSYQLTNYAYCAPFEHGAITLPPDLCGEVILADALGNEIDRFSAGEKRIPSRRRLQIMDPCTCGGCVRIEASRQFFPVWCDDDLVETDNLPALEEMANYLRIWGKTDKDQGDINAALTHKQQAFSLLQGDHSRELGALPQVIVNHSRVFRRRSGLPSRR